MKAYGLPRHTDVEAPDKADLQRFALAGSKTHNRVERRATRRLFKRAARREGREACLNWVQ